MIAWDTTTPWVPQLAWYHCVAPVPRTPLPSRTRVTLRMPLYQVPASSGRRTLPARRPQPRLPRHSPHLTASLPFGRRAAELASPGLHLGNGRPEALVPCDPGGVRQQLLVSGQHIALAAVLAEAAADAFEERGLRAADVAADALDCPRFRGALNPELAELGTARHGVHVSEPRQPPNLLHGARAPAAPDSFMVAELEWRRRTEETRGRQTAWARPRRHWPRLRQVRQCSLCE